MYFRDVLVLFVILKSFECPSNAYKFRGVPENEEVFSDCANQPVGVLNINGLFDISKINLELGLNEIILSGNLTHVWDVKPTDRIEAKFEAYWYNRGTWERTLYAINVQSFCPVMFDKNQYWDKLWLQHLTNYNHVKDKCVNTPGTKYIHEPFSINLNFEGPTNIEGRVKLIMKFTAFDMFNRRRPTSICSEVICEVERN